ncbi:TPA: hypothetical protein MHZ58_25625, partial [Klebsiella pneumoniae subsp. pneumoniae]|nr:hypothetical protein [Klebsiella pneumoniae subsp. pneumoniae]
VQKSRGISLLRTAWSTTLNESVRRAFCGVRVRKRPTKGHILVFLIGVILLYLMRFATTEPQRALYHE